MIGGGAGTQHITQPLDSLSLQDTGPHKPTTMASDLQSPKTLQDLPTELLTMIIDTVLDDDADFPCGHAVNYCGDALSCALVDRRFLAITLNNVKAHYDLVAAECENLQNIWERDVGRDE